MRIRDWSSVVCSSDLCVGFLWRMIMITPDTITLPSFGNALVTSPCLPLSMPDRTTTLSPFLIFAAAMILQNLRRKRDDLHMLLRAQFADDRAEDTGSDRLGIGVDEDGRVGIEADSRPVGAVDVLRGTDDDGLVDVALLHAAARSRFLDGDEIGRASCRERVCPYVSISVVAVSFKKKNKKQ